MIPDANLGWLFTEVPFEDRFAAAARAEFTAIESPWPPIPAPEVAARLGDNGLRSVLVNLRQGEPGTEFAFGWACHPDHVDTFRETFLDALAYAEITGTRYLHVLGGLRPEGVEPAEAYAVYHENLTWGLAQLPSESDTVLVVEAINRRDNPRFLFSGLDEVADLVRSIGHSRVRVLFDTFHAGVEELVELELNEPSTRGAVGALQLDVASRYAAAADVVGHVQLGDAPDRTDPGSGVIDFDRFFTALRDLGWSGFVGGEYRPVAGTEAGLGWRDLLRPGVVGESPT